MMEQLKLAQEKRKQKQPIDSDPNQSAQGSSQKKSSPSPVVMKPSQIKRDSSEKNKKTHASLSPRNSGDSLGNRRDKIVRKLKEAKEWQLKAIEAILNHQNAK